MRWDSLLLLLIKRYNLFEVLACSTSFFHLSLSCATFFQLRTFIFFISSITSSSHHNLGLPVGLLPMGFHLLIFFTLLSSVTRSTWPNQFNLCFLINPIIFCPFSVSLISWFVLIPQQPSSDLVGPTVFIFHYKHLNFMDHRNTEFMYEVEWYEYTWVRGKAL